MIRVYQGCDQGQYGRRSDFYQIIGSLLL